MPAVVEIDRETQRPPWGERKFVEWLKQDGNVLQVCEHRGEVLGWVAYQVNRLHLEVLAVGVNPTHQRKGVGKFILEELVKKLPALEKNRVGCDVFEELTEAQLWLKACGFEAVRMNGEFIRFAKRRVVNVTVPVPVP